MPDPRSPAGTGRWAPESRWWLAVAIAAKAALALVLSLQANTLEKGRTAFRLFIDAGDTYSYVLPIENLLARGWYVLDPAQPLSQAGRMPGYGFTYLIFRAFSSQEVAKSLLAALQILLSGASLYYIALTAFLLLRRRVVFYAVLVLYGTSLFVSTWDYRLITESLATSAGVFYLYHLVRYDQSRNRWRLLAASFWFAYLVFLRPYAIPLLLAAVPFVWPAGKSWRQALPKVALSLTVVASLFLVADTAWMIRNHRIFKKLVPFQINAVAGYHYTAAEWSLFVWFRSVGQDPVYWQPNVLASWFYRRAGFSTDNFRVPAYLTTSQCSLSDIQRARDLFDVSKFGPDAPARDAADVATAQIIDRCTESFEREKPLQHIVIAPLRVTKAFFVHAGPELPIPAFRTVLRNPKLIVLKLSGVASYWLVLVAGLVGLWRLVRLRDWKLWALVSPFLLVTGLFTIVFRRPEIRMLTLGYPALCCLAALAFEALWLRVRSMRRSQ